MRNTLQLLLLYQSTDPSQSWSRIDSKTNDLLKPSSRAHSTLSFMNVQLDRTLLSKGPRTRSVLHHVYYFLKGTWTSHISHTGRIKRIKIDQQTKYCTLLPKGLFKVANLLGQSFSVHVHSAYKLFFKAFVSCSDGCHLPFCYSHTGQRRHVRQVVEKQNFIRLERFSSSPENLPRLRAFRKRGTNTVRTHRVFYVLKCTNAHQFLHTSRA